MGQRAPRGTRSDHPSQAMQDFAQAVLTLRRIFGHEDQIGGKGPCVITDFGEVGFSLHTSSLASVD
jgi:hypothetical protein